MQVWRPVRGRHGNVKRHHLRHQGDVITTENAGGNYTLIGQTYFHPSELRFHEFTLADRRRIAFRRGDVLGLRFARYNPLTWSSVPCADPAQHHLVSRPVITQPLTFGMTLRFDVETGPDDDDCRHYSFTAVLGQCSCLLHFANINKLVGIYMDLFIIYSGQPGGSNG